MSKGKLPPAIQAFVEKQATMPVGELWEPDPDQRESPYGSCYYRAVACALLAGRVRPKNDHDPNLVEVNRFGKEANFNQYLFERIGKMLVALDVIQVIRDGPYTEGSNGRAFWSHDEDQLRAVAPTAVIRLVQRATYRYTPWDRTVDHNHVVDLLVLFFRCFDDLAVESTKLGQILRGFACLPTEAHLELARQLGLKTTAHQAQAWRQWLSERNTGSLIAALNLFEWVYYMNRDEPRDKSLWCFVSPIGLGLLGLGNIPPAPKLATTFKALSNQCVFAGAGLPPETLIPLFRYCVVKKIDRVFEFKVDAKRMAQSPSSPSPSEELHRVLKPLEPLPSTIRSVLGTKSSVGGTIGVRFCTAIVKPESAEILELIRKHPRLKGYIEAGAPPGYLLIKPQSDPDQFLLRCTELGFKVKSL